MQEQSKARRGLTRSFDARRGHTRLHGYRWGALLVRLGPLSGPPPPERTQNITSARQAQGQPRCTADSMAIGDRRREHLDANEEDAEQEGAEQGVHAGGMRGSHDSPAPLHCFAPADSTHGKSALVASVAPGRCGCDRVRLMHDRAGSGRRGRAHERRWGEVWRIGIGWAAHRKSLILGCPVSFSELTNPTNPSQLQRPGSPISRHGAEKSWGSLGEGLE
jgi:hypothetical protein